MEKNWINVNVNKIKNIACKKKNIKKKSHERKLVATTNKL